MSDYISRKAAVKIAQKYGLANGSALGRHTGLADCIAIEIEGLPAADVEPVRRGWWKTFDSSYWRSTQYGVQEIRLCKDSVRFMRTRVGGKNKLLPQLRRKNGFGGRK